MQCIVVNERRLLPPCLEALLPQALLQALALAVPEGLLLEEIRLRRDHAASATVGGENIPLPYVASGEEMEAQLVRFCNGSLYAHAETLARGYLLLPSGVRVGVAGHAAVTGESVTGIAAVSTFAIRVPHQAPAHVGQEPCRIFAALGGTRGILLYAPPGVGKTTVLRGIAAQLAGGTSPRRVALVDTRLELAAFSREPSLLFDVLSGYPRGQGIGIATRSLGAEVIVCDEIGDLAEAKEIVTAQTGGVPLVASAHAVSARELLARPAMRLLHEARVFGAYIGISRARGLFSYTYDVLDWEGADAFF